MGSTAVPSSTTVHFRLRNTWPNSTATSSPLVTPCWTWIQRTAGPRSEPTSELTDGESIDSELTDGEAIDSEPTTAEPTSELTDGESIDSEIAFEAPGNEGIDEEPVAPANGKRRRRRDEAKQKSEKQTSKGEAEVIEEPSWQDLSSEPEFAEAVEALSKVVAAETHGFEDELTEENGEGTADLEETPQVSVSSAFDAANSISDDQSEGVTGEDLEPATSLLPKFGAEQEVSDWSTADDGPDPLAELARSVQDEERLPSADDDSTTLAADLVAEAVATYQQQHGDEQRYEAAVLDAPEGTAMFPPLAKALVDGDRVSLEDMEAVLEEHYRTGQSIARILTAQALVSEADLMWGMAEEMGLEFVDLDVVGVDFAEAGTIPEATARHHNVIVIANDDGTPIVAASNPTDVFAMDDLRTIMGRGFIVVVATRSQISSYIGRAFNSGGDAADMAMEASLGFDSTADSGVDDIQAVTEEAPIVRYVNLLILQALNERASDIHVEPTGSDLRIRYFIFSLRVWRGRNSRADGCII